MAIDGVAGLDRALRAWRELARSGSSRCSRDRRPPFAEAARRGAARAPASSPRCRWGHRSSSFGRADRGAIETASRRDLREPVSGRAWARSCGGSRLVAKPPCRAREVAG